MKPVEAFSQHLPIPIYLALWESSDIIWCSMPPGLNPRSLRPDPGQLPIGSNLDNVTSERMRGMYVPHDKRYSKDWTYFIKNGETWSNTKYDEIVKIFTHNHTEHIQHTFEQRSTYLWSPVRHTCRPIEAWIDCLKGVVVLVSKHYQHSGRWPWTAGYPGMKGSWTKAGSAFAIQKGPTWFYPNWSCHHRNPCGITWGANWPMYLVEVGDKSQHVEMCWGKP